MTRKMSVHLSKLGNIGLFNGDSLLLLILSGETDWKVIAIDVEDPLAKDLNGMNGHLKFNLY